MAKRRVDFDGVNIFVEFLRAKRKGAKHHIFVHVGQKQKKKKYRCAASRITKHTAYLWLEKSKNTTDSQPEPPTHNLLPN